MRSDADLPSFGIAVLKYSHPIYFLLNSLALWNFIKSYDIPLTGPSTTTETETVAKYEIMDGAPVKGKLDFSVLKILLVCENLFFY